jgi:hypothetical protein
MPMGDNKNTFNIGFKGSSGYGFRRFIGLKDKLLSHINFQRDKGGCHEKGHDDHSEFDFRASHLCLTFNRSETN